MRIEKINIKKSKTIKNGTDFLTSSFNLTVLLDGAEQHDFPLIREIQERFSREINELIENDLKVTTKK